LKKNTRRGFRQTTLFFYVGREKGDQTSERPQKKRAFRARNSQGKPRISRGDAVGHCKREMSRPKQEGRTEGSTHLQGDPQTSAPVNNSLVLGGFPVSLCPWKTTKGLGKGEELNERNISSWKGGTCGCHRADTQQYFLREPERKDQRHVKRSH